MVYTGYRDKEKRKEYLRNFMHKYRKEQKAKIVELKALASKPITITTAVELVEKIKEL